MKHSDAIRWLQRDASLDEKDIAAITVGQPRSWLCRLPWPEVGGRARTWRRHSERELFVDIYWVKGTMDYEGAHGRIIDHINRLPHLAWVKALMNQPERALEIQKQHERNPLNVALEHMGEPP